MMIIPHQTHILFLFLLTILISPHLTHTKYCAQLAQDIYPGPSSALSQGTIITYGDGILILARTETGTHLFSYDTQSSPKLNLLYSFHTTGVFFSDPFEGLFGYEERGLFHEIDEDGDNVLYYAYGSLGDVKVSVVESTVVCSHAVYYGGDVFVLTEDDHVLRLEFDDGQDEVRVGVEDVGGCAIPFYIQGDERYLVLVCKNETEVVYGSVLSVYLWEKESDMWFFSGIELIYGGMNSKDYFYEYNGMYYYIGDSAIMRTDFNGTVENALSEPASITKVENFLILGSFDPEQGGFIYYDLDGYPIATTYSYPPNSFVMYQNSIYFSGDCINQGELSICKYDTISKQLSVLPGSLSYSSFKNFEVFRDSLYCSLTSDFYGTELYKIENDTIKLVSDIWTGKRSSSPNTFVDVRDTMYFIAKNLYYGEELYHLVEKDSCEPEGFIYYCNPTCTVIDNDPSREPIIYAGELIVSDAAIKNRTFIEGTAIVDNVQFLADVDILDSLILNGPILVRNSSLITVRYYLRTEENEIAILLSSEELDKGKVTVLSGVEIIGQFNITLQSEDPCTELTLLSREYEDYSGITVTFNSHPTCFDYTLFGAIIAIILGCIAICLVVVFSIPKKVIQT